MVKPAEKPRIRSPLRMFFGTKYYTAMRYFKWWFGDFKFSKISGTTLAHEIFSHKTPMLRKLKDVDMYLQHNKVTNLKIAAEKINGRTIHPGETFSYWKAIGRPTKRKGYLEGMILKNGSFEAGIGGGLCQMSNLIYWMTIHTPLTVIERHRHGYDVFPDANRNQPFGSGATCFYNYGDLMIRNDTNDVYQLKIELVQEELTGSWLSNSRAEVRYEVYEKEHIMRPEFWGGYTRHNLICRKKYDLSGHLIGDEYVVDNHAVMMYAPFLENK